MSPTPDLPGALDAREDWEAEKKRWEAWWNHGLHDRVLLLVTAPRGHVAPPDLRLPPESEVDPSTAAVDFDYMVRREIERCRTTYYGGEALPLFGAGQSVGWSFLFGCEPKFHRDTVWVDPIPVGNDGYPELRFTPHNPWWRWYRSGIEKAARASNGRYFILPEMGNDAGDTLAMVRGSQALMLDIAQDPEWVRSAVKTVSDVIAAAYEELVALASAEACGVEGNVNDHGCWWTGRGRGVNCDVSCMVSTGTFEDIFLPPLVETMRRFEHVSYELDGPGAVRHLDALLDLPELDAIQWIPGAGREEIMQWVPLVRRIQDKGKSVHVSAAPSEIEPLLSEISPDGICIRCECETESEARELVELVRRMSGRGSPSRRR